MILSALTAAFIIGAIVLAFGVVVFGGFEFLMNKFQSVQNFFENMYK